MSELPPPSSQKPRQPGRFFTYEPSEAGRAVEQSTTPVSTAKRRLFATVALFVLSFAFRIPPLLNARSTNSDAAVVGLQAMHILKGERSAFLWGSGYQTSADAFVAAAFFKVFGPSPTALMFSALSLHVLLTYLVFATVRRNFGPLSSLVLVLPLIFSPASVHTYALYPPRQAALTLALAAFWAISGAGRATQEWRIRAWLFTGGLLMTLAISADPYPLLIAPLITVYAILIGLVPAQRGVARLGFLPFVIGAVVGLVPFLLLRRAAGAQAGPLGMTTAMLGHHFDLLVSDCLPWALSYKVYFARDVMDYRPWDAPLVFRAIAYVGALVVVMIALYGLVAVFLRGVPWPMRRLGFVGGLAYPLGIGAFLVSVMSMDHFSMRYLVILTLLLPFAAMPAAHILGPKRFALLFAPHVLAAATCGWIGYGPFVRGIVPVRQTPELADDYKLRAELDKRGITYAMADYWASYRLTFLHREKIIVVPRNPAEDRYAPHRRAFEAAPVYAYVYDPGRSRESLEEAERELRAAHPNVEKTNAGRLVIFVVKR